VIAEAAPLDANLATQAPRPEYAWIALAAILLVTSVMRFTVSAQVPLWLDEVQTGVVVSQSTFADFIRQCTYDINAPLYYVLARPWAAVTGLSNFALRALPASLGVLAPLMALASTKVADWRTRITWCGLLACWLPALQGSEEARWYTLTFALGVANTAAFVGAMRSPTGRRAWIWAIVTSLLVLSHYYGAVLAFFQGLAYLLVHRSRALKNWHAGLAFAPAVGSLMVHLAGLVSFTAPGTSWINVLQPSDLSSVLAFILGANLYISFALWLFACVVFRLAALRRGEDVQIGAGDYLWTAVGCALGATALSIGVGFIKPAFVSRYLIAFEPGLLLGLALVATRFAKSWKLAPAALVAMFFCVTIVWAANPGRHLNAFNWERASDELMVSHPSHLVFFWDTPMRPDKHELADLGGFFFRRAGSRVSVDPIELSPGQDPNVQILNEAQSPRTAILWVYDLEVRGTSAIRHPPRLSAIDPRWTCKNYGISRFGIIGCSRDAYELRTSVPSTGLGVTNTSGR
jgi:hypothetical protein